MQRSPQIWLCCLAGALSLSCPLSAAEDDFGDYDFLLNLPVDTSDTIRSEWQGTLELNDTGFDDNNEYRQWLTLQKTDLFTLLDFFAVDFSTDTFDRYHSLSLQYETTPLVNDWYLAFDALYSQDQIDAVETDEVLDDTTTGAGLYLMNLAIVNDWLINAGLGVRWQEIETDNLRIYEGQGENTFLLPGLQLRWQKETAGYSSVGYVHYEWNEPGAGDTRKTERSAQVPVNIGGTIRQVPVTASIDIDTRFQILLLDYEHRLFIGPQNREQDQQLLLNAKAQTSGGDPLLPSFQRSVGGLYSVRGYDDQVLSGNEVIEATLAYEFRLFADSNKESQWQPWLHVFYDWAHVQTDEITVRFQGAAGLVDRTLVVPEISDTLRSAGLALDLHYQQNSLLYIAAAQALADDGLDTDSGDWRIHAYLRFHF